MKKHEFTHSSIEHHGDGSHTIEHHHKDGAHKNVKHAAMNLDHVHDSLQDHLAGPPTQGDQELDNGVHGIPAAQAAPAGLPVPPPAGA